MKKLLLLLLLIAVPSAAQEKSKIEGTVTYKSTQNVYVKFNSTAGMNAGDTLYLKEGNIPAMIIQYLSSGSAAGSLLEGRSADVNDIVFAYIAVPGIVTRDTALISEEGGEIKGLEKMITTRKEYEYGKRELYSGRFNIYSYSGYSNSGGGDYQRWRYSALFKGDNIGGSGFSLAAYAVYNYRADTWSSIENKLDNLRLYELNLKYKLNQEMNIRGGRIFSSRLSSLGAIDGLIYEYEGERFFAGAAAGFRSGSYNLNVKTYLFEAGAYLGRKDSIGSIETENSGGIFQQTNRGNTDRRFIYLQHSSRLNGFNLFISSEMDIYKREMGEDKSSIDITNLLVSSGYQIVKEAAVRLSYDARRNVVYYETYKNFIDSTFENELRQGIRGSLDLKPVRNVYAGINAGYRYKPGDAAPSKNIQTLVNWNIAGFIPGVSFTALKSAYIDGEIYGIRISKSMETILREISAEYRRSSYRLNNSAPVIQNMFNIDLTGRILNNLTFIISFEAVYEKERTSGRIAAGINSRI